MQEEKLIVQTPHPVSRWAPYYISPIGRDELSHSTGLSEKENDEIGKIARWAASRSFDSLLKAVYREAPDFAVRSVLRVDLT